MMEDFASTNPDLTCSSGSFKALLADVNKSPASRFDDGKGTWYRLDGVPVVAQAKDLFASGGPLLTAPIDLFADGVSRAFPMSEAWTGFSGQADDYSLQGTAASTCNGWSSTSSTVFGVTSIVTFTWKSFLDLKGGWPLPHCSEAVPLYCLQE
ncbi:MAG TPA: hypothetical protein VH083_10935 [Myxococcales bacterium]|nr:hypothetical protein [Myxococcales bacterium]